MLKERSENNRNFKKLNNKEVNCVELFSYDQNIIAVKNVRFMIGELNAETNCLCLTISFFQNSMLILHFGLTSYNTVKEAGWPTTTQIYQVPLFV